MKSESCRHDFVDCPKIEKTIHLLPSFTYMLHLRANCKHNRDRSNREKMKMYSTLQSFPLSRYLSIMVKY